MSLQEKTRGASESRVVVIFEWILLAALLAMFAVRGFVPAWRTLNTDFPNYYVAASIHRQGIPLDRAFEWRWFQREKDHLQVDQPLVGFAPHPPMCALPMLALTNLPPLQAKRVWLIVNLGFLALAIWILHRITQLSWRRLLVLTFLCILPLRQNFAYGQYYVLIFLLLCLAYYAAQRGHRFTSGAMLAAAASLKIFPVFFLILFCRKRNWRAALGLVTTGALLTAVTVIVFGWSVHWIYLREVLPRALHGDLLGPYALEWNSFTALCHRFFLPEPETNSNPWFNSPAAYAFIQAIIATTLLFSFLFCTGEEETPQTRAWEWATFLPLLVLLSSMPAIYHYCLLILTAVVAIDLFLKAGQWRTAAVIAVLFAIACFPIPRFALLNLQARLASMLLLYLILLAKAPARASAGVRVLGVSLATIFFALVALSSWRGLHSRSEDFSRRLPSSSAGYATFSIAGAGDQLILNEMISNGYGAVLLPGRKVQRMPAPGDVLSVAASPQSPFVYFELAGKESRIFRLPASQLGRDDATPEYVADGHDPAISADGRWLFYLRDEGGKTTIWASKDHEQAVPVPASNELKRVIDMSVGREGNLIVATGNAVSPHFSALQTSSGEIQSLTDIRGAVRYPAISPDGQALAFVRREGEAWHLFVRDLAAGREQQLTSAECNASSPAWENPKTLLYVSDCGRGLWLSAPVRVTIPDR
jgi:hypothetical protein